LEDKPHLYKIAVKIGRENEAIKRNLLKELKIDDKEIDVPQGTTVLQAAKANKIDIPVNIVFLSCRQRQRARQANMIV